MTNGTTILVADDDRAIRTVLHQALGRQGHTVRSTGAAATLWQWVQEGEGQLVITDVVMPDENGLDLIPRIRKIRPDLRVVVMSAQSTLMTAGSMTLTVRTPGLLTAPAAGTVESIGCMRFQIVITISSRETEL